MAWNEASLAAFVAWYQPLTRACGVCGSVGYRVDRELAAWPAVSGTQIQLGRYFKMIVAYCATCGHVQTFLAQPWADE